MCLPDFSYDIALPTVMKKQRTDSRNRLMSDQSNLYEGCWFDVVHSLEIGHVNTGGVMNKTKLLWVLLIAAWCTPLNAAELKKIDQQEFYGNLANNYISENIRIAIYNTGFLLYNVRGMDRNDYCDISDKLDLIAIRLREVINNKRYLDKTNDFLALSNKDVQDFRDILGDVNLMFRQAERRC